VYKIDYIILLYQILSYVIILNIIYDLNNILIYIANLFIDYTWCLLMFTYNSSNVRDVQKLCKSGMRRHRC